ncbi:hypothetical protein GOBAR_AA11869 [Gossypium barbadense]|uniref:Uncharacterized protein n=1 Tax=Gossypium barbadense TaxID=3634 RepID=A0A2P5XZK8_GOSBA|nr:hypothetical protein GOBAR_AA11869 [Gossypium barbadense]
MLSKIISVLKTHFQNTETALKNQQVSIQGLKTQIGQLSKLISEQPQGSLPSNTKPNPREQLNAINIQDIEGVVEPGPESRQETVVIKGQGEKISLKEAHDSFSSNSRGPIHEDRRLQIEELDEWKTHKPKTPDKSKLRQNEPDASPNKLKVGDKVHNFIFKRKENCHTSFEEEEGSVIFRGSNRENSSPSSAVPPGDPRRAFSNTSGPTLNCGPLHRWAAIEQVQMADTICALLTTDPWELFFRDY